MCAPPFKVLEAAEQLSKYPKLEAISNYPKKSSRDKQSQIIPSRTTPCSGTANITQEEDGSGSTPDARIGNSYPLDESLKGGEELEVDGVGRIPRPKEVRKVKEEQKIETEVRRMGPLISSLNEWMKERKFLNISRYKWSNRAALKTHPKFYKSCQRTQIRTKEFLKTYWHKKRFLVMAEMRVLREMKWNVQRRRGERRAFGTWKRLKRNPVLATCFSLTIIRK